MNLFQLCVYLQLLDLLTTAAGLAHGGKELNPLITIGTHPLLNMVVMKCVGVAVGWCCWRGGYRDLLTLINWGFAAVVVWNLVWMVV